MLNFNFAFSSAFSCFVAICTVLLRGVSLFKQGSGSFTWIVILLLILMDNMQERIQDFWIGGSNSQRVFVFLVLPHFF